MPPEQSSDVKFEIGHVLFIDIVGYSKLLITEQSEQIQKLREIVNPVRWRTGWKRPAPLARSRFSIRFGMIRASKNSAKRNQSERQFLLRT